MRVSACGPAISWDTFTAALAMYKRDCPMDWPAEVKRVEATDMLYGDFLVHHLLGGLPLVLTGVSDVWRASQCWRDGGDPCGILWPALLRDMGHASGFVHGEEGCLKETTLSEYHTSFWLNPESVLGYFKDCHIPQASLPHPEQHEAVPLYHTPSLLSHDSLNTHCDRVLAHAPTTASTPAIPPALPNVEWSGGEDYRFLYIGPEGSRTPHHADVFRSYSWSANVVGTKRWTLHPQTPSEAPAIHITQEQGSCVFVPSDCFHSVENTSDCISINHNWLNPFNSRNVARFLLSEYREVCESLEDLCADPEFPDLCQKVLRANSGMDMLGLVALLREMVCDALTLLPRGEDGSQPGEQPAFSASLSLCILVDVLLLLGITQDTSGFVPVAWLQQVVGTVEDAVPSNCLPAIQEVWREKLDRLTSTNL